MEYLQQNYGISILTVQLSYGNKDTRVWMMSNDACNITVETVG